MTDLKISQLPDAGPLQSSDLIPIVRKSGSELITAKTTVSALSGGGNWNPSAKYEFGNTYFAVKNMNLGGEDNQILVDEAPGNNTIGLFATSDGDLNASFLKLYGNGYAALGVEGKHAFLAMNNCTQILCNGKPMLAFAPHVTNLHHYTQGIVFSANEDGVQINRQGNAVFGAFDSKTDLCLKGKPVFSAIDTTTSLFRDGKTVFSAGPNSVGVSINGNSILEAGNNYTELHINTPTGTTNLLHADQNVLKLFHKNKAILNCGTSGVGTTNQNPFSIFEFVDDRGTTNTTKKILEASPYYTTLYFDNKQVLDFKKNSFVLCGIDNNNNAIPLIEKHSTNTFVRFHDMSSSNTNSSVFMQASASNVTMYRDINLSTSNKDIQIGTGNWGSTQNLKGILTNLVSRIAALEAKI